MASAIHLYKPTTQNRTLGLHADDPNLTKAEDQDRVREDLDKLDGL